MENLVAKVSYLKGLCDGLAIDESKPEGKLLVNIVDVLKDLAAALDDVIDALIMADQAEKLKSTEE